MAGAGPAGRSAVVASEALDAADLQTLLREFEFSCPYIFMVLSRPRRSTLQTCARRRVSAPGRARLERRAAPSSSGPSSGGGPGHPAGPATSRAAGCVSDVSEDLASKARKRSCRLEMRA